MSGVGSIEPPSQPHLHDRHVNRSRSKPGQRHRRRQFEVSRSVATPLFEQIGKRSYVGNRLGKVIFGRVNPVDGETLFDPLQMRRCEGSDR